MVASVSTAFEEEVLRRGVVVWLDKDGVYTPFVDDLVRRHREGTLREPVVAFRGSFLEVVLALESFGTALDSTALLLHMPRAMARRSVTTRRSSPTAQLPLSPQPMGSG